MNQTETIRWACRIVALAYRSIGDYGTASDGFCEDCPNHRSARFRHDGVTLKYVEQAVKEKLLREGFALDPRVLEELKREGAK